MFFLFLVFVNLPFVSVAQFYVNYPLKLNKSANFMISHKSVELPDRQVSLYVFVIVLRYPLRAFRAATVAQR